MRTALTTLHAERGGAAGEPNLRALVHELLSGEIAAPTADVAALVRQNTDPDAFYSREVGPSWDGLNELQRARRVDGFVELAEMLDANPGAAPAEMTPVVHTKTLVLAWAFDETYGYLGRLARGEAH